MKLRSIVLRPTRLKSEANNSMVSVVLLNSFTLWCKSYQSILTFPSSPMDIHTIHPFPNFPHSTENSLAKSYACPCRARKMKQTPRHPHVPAPHPWPDQALLISISWVLPKHWQQWKMKVNRVPCIKMNRLSIFNCSCFFWQALKIAVILHIVKTTCCYLQTWRHVLWWQGGANTFFHHSTVRKTWT